MSGMVWFPSLGLEDAEVTIMMLRLFPPLDIIATRSHRVLYEKLCRSTLDKKTMGKHSFVFRINTTFTLKTLVIYLLSKSCLET